MIKAKRFCFFFFNDTATTEIYTLSLHDALPNSRNRGPSSGGKPSMSAMTRIGMCCARSEEHTSELQSRFDLVCRLLLEKKKKIHHHRTFNIVYNSDVNISLACSDD